MEDTLSQVWTEKRVLDEMEAKNEKLALLGMLGYDLTWHRYIYKTRLKRAIEKMEKLIFKILRPIRRRRLT